MIRYLAKFCIWITGWKTAGTPVPISKSVMVIAYHTSNWDAAVCIAFNLALRTRVSFVAKESVFWWPLGNFLRSVGGVAVKRGSKEDFVGRMVGEFKSRDYFVLAMTPEGTRKRTGSWKTGFYYIALGAGVPVQLAALDYKNKAFVFSPPMDLTGNLDLDVGKMREFFRPTEPRHPRLADKDFTVAK